MSKIIATNNKNKLTLAITLMIIVLGTIYFVLQGNKNRELSNSQIAFYYEDNGNQIKTDTIPEGYMLDTYNCSNDNVKLSWNSASNRIRIKAKGAATCTVYLKEYIPINTIEDLVDLSIDVNNGNTHAGEIYLLMKDLDFDDPDSYEDSTRADYNDINGDSVIEDIMTELTTSTGWMPIGIDETNSFQGTFDGGEHRIDNLYIERAAHGQALFGIIKNASVRNLTVGGSVNNTSTEGYNIGGIVSVAYNVSYVTNCVNEVNVTSNSIEYSVGGVVAAVRTDANSNLTIIDCINRGNISGGSQVGGIIAYNGGTLMIQHSYNVGTITQTKGNYAGGILGRDNATTNTTTIINSRNDGILTSTNKTNGAAYVAGIMGFSHGTTTINNSYNNAEIIGSMSKTSILGGLLGYVNLGVATINDSYNTKDGTLTGNKAMHVGGLIGLVYHSARTSINNSHNDGLITSNVKYDYHINGGLIGDVDSSSSTTINNSYNTGTISCGKGDSCDVGGLIGYVGQTSGTATSILINNSYNTGRIIDVDGHTGSEYLGGLIGAVRKNTIINNSYNLGAVSITNSSIASDKVGYVGGLVGTSNSEHYLKILNSYNGGVLSSINLSATTSSRLGGLIGVTFDNMSNYIYNSYNVGSITNPNNSEVSYAGGLVGRAYASETYPSTKLNIYNSYNKGAITNSNPYGVVYLNDYMINNNLNTYTFDKVYYLDTVTNGSNVTSNNLISTAASTFNSSAFVAELNNNLNTIDKTNVPEGYTLNSWKLGPNLCPVFDN